MNLIEYWGSGIPRIIGKVKVAGLREPEFIGGDVDLRINIYREQIEPVDDVPDTIERLPDNEQMKHIYKDVLENGSITTARAAELLGVKQRRARAVLLDMVKKNYLKRRCSTKYDLCKKFMNGDVMDCE